MCLHTKKTPACPVVSLTLATEFNEVAVLDLKEWKKGKMRILHLIIDAATRFTLSALIYNKHSSTILTKLWLYGLVWVLEYQRKYLETIGGEFANEEYKDMCENLNTDVKHIAADCAWQNGLCEHNHAIIDSALTRIVEDNKNISLEIVLVWALHAKNCLHMNSEYSSYQFVFGRNPNLPMYYMTNHLHYTEQQLAKHLLNILTHYIKVDKHLLNQNHQEESVELYTIKFMLKIKFMKQEILFIIKEPKRKNGEGQEK